MKFSKIITSAVIAVLVVACGTTQPSSYWQQAKAKAQAAADKAKAAATRAKENIQETYYEKVRPQVTSAYGQVSGSMSNLRDKAADVSSSVKNRFRDFRPSAAQQAAEEQNMAEMNEWARSQGLMPE